MVENDFLKHLNRNGNIRVVIGNGFDLFCGIHTTYSDYYCKNWRKYISIQAIIDNYVNQNHDIDFSNNVVNSYNVWDVFFALHSDKDPRKCKQKWCDIEKLILASLIREKSMTVSKEMKEIGSLSIIHWPDLKHYLNSKATHPDLRNRLMAEFVDNKMNQGGYISSDYYDFLLDQLHTFEVDFGRFISSQIMGSLSNENGNSLHLNGCYYRKVKNLLKELCPLENTIRVDTFNYSDLVRPLSSVNCDVEIVLNHINGSCSNPIFGIDSKFSPSDPRFIFTKTSRRIESKMVFKNYLSEESFNHVVIFGHSLDEADYSYFFPIFDKLNMLDSNAKGTLVFAFNIYDSKKTKSIKKNLRQGVSKMLYNYALEHQVSNPNRFLDSVSTQKRILFYEVKNTNKRDSEKEIDRFEEEWKKTIEMMELELEAKSVAEKINQPIK